MSPDVNAVNPTYGLHGIADRRRDRRRNDGAFEKALGENGEELAEENEPDAQPPVPRGLQDRGPIVRKDDRDGSLHVDVLA